MSYYSDASLVMIPSGVKNGTVFSQKPLSSDGELTFSRASNATRVNSSGLVEKVRTNEVIQSENFSTWTPRPSSSVTSNTIANPLDGAITADTINQGTNIYSGVFNSISASSNYWTNSVYLKAGNLNYAYVLINGSPSNYAWFNLSTGSVSGVTSNELASITDVGGGWYRCAIYSKVLTFNSVLQFGFSDAAVFTPSISGYGYAFGAQAELSDFGPTPYIATTSSAVSVGPVSGLPRLDYSGGASCPSLLLEPQRTNLVGYSEQFDNAFWSKVGSTITANNTTSPDGYVNADKLIEDTSTGGHNVNKAFNVTTGANTISVRAKAGERNWILLRDTQSNSGRYFDLTNGVIGSVQGTTPVNSTIKSLTDGWYDVSITITAPATTVSVYIYVTNADATLSHTGDGVSGIYIWGAQLEEGAYETSYINSLSTAVTRVADSALKTGISSLIGQTEGTLFFECTNKALVNQARYFLLSDGTFNNRIDIYQFSEDNLGVYVAVGGTAQVSATNVTLPSSGSFKFALGYANNDYVWYLNGTQIGTDTSASVPTLTNALFALNAIGGALGGSGNSPFKQALLFKTRLSNSDLATLTA